jgi:hypothetical protein
MAWHALLLPDMHERSTQDAGKACPQQITTAINRATNPKQEALAVLLNCLKNFQNNVALAASFNALSEQPSWQRTQTVPKPVLLPRQLSSK